MTPITPTPGALPPRQTDPLMAKARDLEAAFLAEMLTHAGLGAPADAFGGGQGEAQFASFMRQEQARLMVQGGGIGLAQAIFQAMTARQDGDVPSA